MKTIKLFTTILTLGLLISCGVQEQNNELHDHTTHQHTSEDKGHVMLKVWGNCGMCKKTIEEALAGVNGLIRGEWDVKKKVLHVEFDSSKTSVEMISKAVAASGYDTEYHTADNDAYNNLHTCCQYDRK